MTIIQPHKAGSLLDKIIIVLIAVLMLGSFWLVTLYNRLVNLNHGIADLNAELNTLRTESAELKEKIFDLLSSEHLEKFASSRQLVEDRNPRYFEVDQQWFLASH